MGAECTLQTTIKGEKMPSVFQRAVVSAGVVAVTIALTAGCGSSSSGGKQSVTPAAGGLDKAAAALVPASIKSKGKIVVAEDATYAPDEFIGSDGKTVVGMDADLAKAIGVKLGLSVDVTNETFDGIIPGIQSGKYDAGMSSFTDTKEREKVVDFVDYYRAGTSFFTATSGGTSISGLADLCGLKVSVEKGTTEQTDAQAQSKKCTNAGNKAVTVDTYPDQNAANLAVTSGHDQIGMADSPPAAYQVTKSNGQLKLVGTPYGVAPYGIALPKGNGMDKAVLAAVKSLMADGTYTKILKRWNLTAGAITNPGINGAIS
jgi:polar amino acid transport system substrate-binding protein